MSTSLAYHTQGIVGFQHHSFQYSEGKVIQRLKRKEFRCPKCFHCSVNAHHYRTRRIQGLPYGGMKVYFEVELHRIYCPRCRALSVDQGKDGDALRAFLLLLRRSKAEIEVVAMDMGKAFIHWVKEHLPSAQIVFDHFHVIKLMNEKLDLVRRRIAAKLDADERAILKNQRFTLLRNEENLSSEATAYLAKIKQTFQELADVHMMKEALRSIYSVAQNVSQAEDALLRWVKAAQKIQSDQLHKMAKTILQYWDGILGFWRFGNMTNASMEGFNNKVRTMLRQAYGYRDLEYMRLKIFNLPNNNLKIII